MTLISDSEKQIFKDAYQEFFDSFKEQITVHRRGKTVLVDIYLDQLFGYGEYSTPANYTYQAVNQAFDALVIYPEEENNTSNYSLLNEIRTKIVDSEIIIKVKEDCKNYLSYKDVERIDVGTKSYTLESEEVKINKVINDYYLFKLRETK